MTDLRLQRDFSVAPEKLFRFVTGSGELIQWFGPEGISVPDNDLDFSRTGPWYAVMTGADGPVAKVSGHVTHVDPPRSVGFTWGWHDDDDKRGAESHVTFTILPTASGSRLIINHRDLGAADIAANHERGWTSSLRKLDALLA